MESPKCPKCGQEKCDCLNEKGQSLLAAVLKANESEPIQQLGAESWLFGGGPHDI